MVEQKVSTAAEMSTGAVRGVGKKFLWGSDLRHIFSHEFVPEPARFFHRIIVLNPRCSRMHMKRLFVKLLLLLTSSL